MTKEEAIRVVSLSIPSDRTDKTEIAESYLHSALLDTVLLDQYDFNQQRIDFTIETNMRTMVIGEDILSDISDVYGMTDIYFTNAHEGERKILMLPKQRFQTEFSSETRQDTPRVATMYHSADRAQLTLEVYPKSDANYTVFAFAKRALTRWDDIPPHGQAIIANWAARKVSEMIARAAGVGPKDLSRAVQNAGTDVFRGDKLMFQTQFEAHGRFGKVQANSFDLTGSREE